jgi:hypothetical protein
MVARANSNLNSIRVVHEKALENSIDTTDVLKRHVPCFQSTAILGKRLSIDNKQHGVFVGPVLTIEITQFSF